MFSHRLSIGNSVDDSDGGGSSGVARCSRGARCNSHSTDEADSIHMDNNRIHTKDSNDTHSSDNRPRFPLTPARQNAAQVRKQIRMPSMQLTEPFSLWCSLLCLLFWEGRPPFQGFPWTLNKNMRHPL
jgi:hypothetical protein